MSVYPNALLFYNDWRGPGIWTPELIAAREATNPAMASVSQYFGSTGHTTKPMPGVTTLVGCQSSLSTYNGAPGSIVFDANDPPYVIASEGRALGYDLMPVVTASGQKIMSRVWTYHEGPGAIGSTNTDPAHPELHSNAESWAINLSRPVVCNWFADKIIQFYGNFDGWHNDYWTTLDWLFAPTTVNDVGTVLTGFQNPTVFGDLYTRGLNRIAHRIRAKRAAQGKTTFILGDQFHNTTDPALYMRELNGRFIERYPQAWGTGTDAQRIATQQGYFDEWASYTTQHGGAKSSMCIELDFTGYVGSLTADRKNQAMTFANDNACMVAWGRDADAGIASAANGQAAAENGWEGA